MPKISVIVPAYNVEDHIGKCISSILSQTFEDFELIIVDDGSTDQTVDICDSYAVTDKRVNIIHQTNSGVSAARNAGLDVATGEYVVFIDSDDYIDIDFIEILYRNKSDLTMCGLTVETGQGKHLYSIKYDFVNYCSKDQIDYAKFYKENLLYSPCCKILSNGIIKSNHLCFPEEVNWGEDAIFIADYLQYIQSVCVVDYEGYHYIKYGDESSLSTTIRYDIIEMIEKSRLYCIDKMTVTAPDQVHSVEKICHEDIKYNCAYFVKRLLDSEGISVYKKNKFLKKYMESSFVIDTFEQSNKYYTNRNICKSALSKKKSSEILILCYIEKLKKTFLSLFYKCWIIYRKICRK